MPMLRNNAIPRNIQYSGDNWHPGRQQQVWLVTSTFFTKVRCSWIQRFVASTGVWLIYFLKNPSCCLLQNTVSSARQRFKNYVPLGENKRWHWPRFPFMKSEKKIFGLASIKVFSSWWLFVVLLFLAAWRSVLNCSPDFASKPQC